MNSNTTSFLGLGASILLGAFQGAQAQVVTLTPLKDNTLYESATGALSSGAGIYIFAGRTFQSGDADQRRGLLSFDIAGNIPAGATITAVTLTLRASKTTGGNATVSLHKATQSWGEGTSGTGSSGGGGGSARTTGDATWLHTSGSSLWNTQGGDFSASASASQTVGSVGTYTWSSAGMVADVQSWLNTPASNFGWFLIGNESASGTAKRFDSREISTASFRPSLQVSYVPEPSALASAALLGLVGLATLRRHRAGFVARQ